MRFKIVILGTGNVGHHLACAFSAAGHQVTIWNRTVENIKQTISACNAKILNKPELIDNKTDFCILALNEDGIVSVCKQIPPIQGILLHTAGSVPIDILKPFATHYGVLYPFQTFSKERKLDYSKIPVFTEGSDLQAIKTINSISTGVFGTVSELDSLNRSYLHLAAVFACNFVNASLMAAQEISETYSVDFNHLMPLIEETIEKNKNNNPVSNQTGPAVRNNMSVIEKHIEMIKKQPELQSFYIAVTDYIQKKFNKK